MFETSYKNELIRIGFEIAEKSNRQFPHNALCGHLGFSIKTSDDYIVALTDKLGKSLLTIYHSYPLTLTSTEIEENFTSERHHRRLELILVGMNNFYEPNLIKKIDVWNGTTRTHGISAYLNIKTPESFLKCLINYSNLRDVFDTITNAPYYKLFNEILSLPTLIKNIKINKLYQGTSITNIDLVAFLSKIAKIEIFDQIYIIDSLHYIAPFEEESNGKVSYYDSVKMVSFDEIPVHTWLLSELSSLFKLEEELGKLKNWFLSEEIDNIIRNREKSK
jgi:hypothetical protein